MTKDLHAFFISNTFFQLSLSVAKFSNELNLKCWFNVAYYTKTLFNRNTLYCTSISSLPLGLFTSYLCDLSFHYHCDFHYN